ncbi:MAG: hypothetical protein U1E70_25325 [Acetobacteraceae bacterium]|nr:hypothetical protein [Pseudomonadota bacterium]
MVISLLGRAAARLDRTAASLRGGAAIITAALAVAACTPTGNAPSAMDTGKAADGKNGLYSFHTGPASGCPGLDWHVVLHPDGKITGMVGWAGMTRTATLSGTMARNDTFTGTATEAKTGRTATISGSAGGTYIAISIAGTGTPCDNVVLNVPRAMGGMGGGGGG